MKHTPFDLTARVAVITGSSRGIGRSSAELLAKLGARVVISSRKAGACEEVADHMGIAFVYQICAVLPAIGLLAVFLPKMLKAMR